MPAPVPAAGFHGRCWRVLAPRWATAPLSGRGAVRRGGRYNEPGVEARYISLDLMTDVAEYEQDLGIRPGTFCASEVAFADGVVDLLDPATRQALGIAAPDLHCPWKEILLVDHGRPPTWEIARRLIEEGRAGARVPSARQPGGVSLVLWRWNAAPEREVRVLDPQGDLLPAVTAPRSAPE